MIQIDIPMPTSCADCPMCLLNGWRYYCNVTLDYIDIGEWDDERKPNCPIVEVQKELG